METNGKKREGKVGGRAGARGGEASSRMEERVKIRKEWRDASVDS